MHLFEHVVYGKGGEGETGERQRVRPGRYFRAMHFFTESRVHAADMLTDAENAGAPQ